MKAHPEKNYIYVTPFLDEINRVIENIEENRLEQPDHIVLNKETGTTSFVSKLDSFNHLLATQKSIAVSHATFLNATPETIALIKEGEYTIIIDEALEVVSPFNEIRAVEYDARQKMTGGDIRRYLREGKIRIDTDNRVIWTGDEEDIEDSKDREVCLQAKLGNLYCSNKSLLYVMFPKEIFEVCVETFILTYMVKESTLDYYFQLHHIEYEMASLEGSGMETTVVPYSSEPDIDFRRKLKGLITINENPRYQDHTFKLSMNWYHEVAREENQRSLDKLKRILTSFYRSCDPPAKASREEIMWTCPKDYKTKLAGRGYTCVRSISGEDKKLEPDDFMKRMKELDCFVSCNARASNDYRNRWALAYCCHMYRNPMLEGLFRSNGIKVDSEQYSLSCLVQWMCRSRVRDDLPITILIVNDELREQFKDWINV